MALKKEKRFMLDVDRDGNEGADMDCVFNLSLHFTFRLA